MPSVTYVLEHFLALQTSAIIVAFSVGVFVYIRSRLYARERDLNPFGNSGNWFYDAAVGHELHPRLFRGLDLKLFTYTRLSMISTAVLSLLFLIKDFENRGGIGKSSVNIPLLLIVVQQLIYVTDFLFFEVCAVFFLQFFSINIRKIELTAKNMKICLLIITTLRVCILCVSRPKANKKDDCQLQPMGHMQRSLSYIYVMFVHFKYSFYIVESDL